MTPFKNDPDLVATKGSYLTRQTQLIARFRQVEYEEKYERMKRDTHIDFVDTYAAAFRRNVFFQAGGFDELLIAAEDVDLSFRLSRIGAKMLFVPEARVFHRHDRALGTYLKKKTRFAFWRFLAIRKTPEKALKDLHTPQLAKLQILLVAAMLATLVISVVPIASAYLWPLMGIFAAAFIVTTIPSLLFCLKRDPIVGLIISGMFFIRALTGLAGIALALLRPNHYRRPPTRPLGQPDGMKSPAE